MPATYNLLNPQCTTGNPQPITYNPKVADFNILQLYKQVFDVSAVNFNMPVMVSNAEKTALAASEFALGEAIFKVADIARNNRSKDSNYYQNIPTIGTLDAAKTTKSTLGTPIFEQIILKIPAKTGPGGEIITQGFTYTFPDWPLFDITPAWIIKKENVQGGKGSVKEFIQQDDFAITIRGFLINYLEDSYPYYEVKNFWQAVNCQQSIEITSGVINALGIQNIVIESAKLVGVEGYMNIQPFEINCISDNQIELLLK